MPNTHRSALIAAACAGTLFVSGCHRGAPDGQVVARVNGEEITQTDLNAELAATGVPAAARAKAGPFVLQKVVERKLLAQEAAKDGVDKDPDFALMRRRGDEIMLAQRYVQRQARRAREQPTGDQIEAYLHSHPALAEGRQMLTLDQVRFPMPGDAAEVRELQGATTMDALVAVLTRRGVPFQREAVRSDTAGLPDAVMASIDKLKPGEPLVITGGPALVAAAVTNRQAIPTPSAQATQIARNRIVMETVNKRMQQEQVALRQGARIDYAKGMAPPAPPAVRPPR